jgi:adenylate cyclase
VLEASRSHHIPHQSMCGGRARCSTCRVRVISGEADCPAPESDELRTLERIGAQPDVRLACQLRPAGDVSVIPLLAAAPSARAGASAQTVEREVVVMLIDLQNRDALAALLLPQDQFYLLRLFSEAACAAVAQAGGLANPQQGANILAVFGREQPLPLAARAALAAADQITQRIEHLNARLEHEFGHRISLRIRIDAGHAVVGEIGHGDTHALAVTGEAPESAQRLQPGNDSADGGIVISDTVRRAAGGG